jgi:hypothetical protein
VSGVNAPEDDVVGVGGAVVRGALLDVLADVGDGDACDVASKDFAGEEGNAVAVVTGVEAGPIAVLDPHAASISTPQTVDREVTVRKPVGVRRVVDVVAVTASPSRSR